MMQSIPALLAVLFASTVFAFEPSTWVFIPSDEESNELPQRLEFKEGDVVVSQMLFAGVSSEERGTYTIEEKTITCQIDGEPSPILTIAEDSLVWSDPSGDRVFHPTSPEEEAKFADAPPIPRSKEEAIETLLRLFPAEARKEFAATKREDLIQYHFGFGMTIRNAFGLWNPVSPLREDLGGGHPDDASMVLIVAFWERLQQDAEDTANEASSPDE